MYPDEPGVLSPERPPALPLDEPLALPLALIINARARRGRDALLPAKAALGPGLVLSRALEDPRGLRAAIDEAAARGARTVVVGGGDGTMRSVVAPVLRHGLTLGVLPLGTANDFARSLRLPLEIAAAAEVIARGRTLEVDVGVVDGLPFLNAVSAGVSADCAQRLDAQTKRRLGVLAYPVSAIAAAARHRPFHARLEIDGERFEAEVLQIVVGNSRYQGGGRLIDLDATPVDRILHVYAVLAHPAGGRAHRWARNVWRLGRVGWLTRSGRHASYPHVLTARGAEIRLSTEPPVALDVDGELCGKTPARFRQLPNALRVRVPPHPTH